MKANIGKALFLLVISGLVLYFGGLTLDMWDAGRWGMMTLGIFATLAIFAGMVLIVSELTSRKDDEADD